MICVAFEVQRTTRVSSHAVLEMHLLLMRPAHDAHGEVRQ